MSSTVLYFNRGESCYIRLVVSIFSLRKHFSGAVMLINEGPLDRSISELVQKLEVVVRELPSTTEHVLVRKASLWRYLEHDHVMYLDSDTIVCKPIDEFFDRIKEWGTVVTAFEGWKTTGGMMRKRIEQWRAVAPDVIQPAFEYAVAINTGVQGWSKGAAILPRYEEFTRRGEAGGCSGILLDEIAMQLLVPHHRHYVASASWNTSGSFGEIRDAHIVHFHGKKHGSAENPRCHLWKQHYYEVLAAFPDHAEALKESWGDKRLHRFLKSLERRSDMTIVTAVDPKYAGKLERNIKAWLQLPGLRDQQFLVLVNGFKGSKQRRFLEHPNVRVVRWDYGDPSVTRREFMLAAFLFGVAQRVKTRYWMKLDADCRPQRGWWEWPDYENYTVVSHRWGFTRMKGDGEATRHWFNRLDDIFSPAKPLFRKMFAVNGSVSHRRGNAHDLPMRFNSFCHIEKTEFTRRMAQHLNETNGGKMAIPSQDTTAWYCSALWREPVQLMNMKKWFKN